jgi:hypothetical protein
MILDDTEEDDDQSEDNEEDNQDQEGSANENEDLQELGGASLKQKMASEVCNLMKL